MTKIKSFEGLMAHNKKRKKIVIPMCINPQGTLTGKEFTALSDMAHRATDDVQIYVEDNTSEYHLSLISLTENTKPSELEEKVLENARFTGKPILIKKADNSCVVYGDQNGKWDFASFDTSGLDLEHLPFDTGILRRQDALFNELLKEKLKSAHVPYYTQWLKDNALEEGKDVISIHSLQKHPLWQKFNTAFTEYRIEDGVEAQLSSKLEQDKAKVLPSHPDWAEDIDEHNLQTALYWAFLHIGKEPKAADAITFLLYPYESSKTGNFITQFAQDRFANQWYMQNTEHFRFNIKFVMTEQAKLIAQEKSMPQPVGEAKEVKSEHDVTESIVVLEEKQLLPKRLHPEASKVMSDAISNMVLTGNVNQATYFILSFSDFLFLQDTKASTVTSTAQISRGFQQRQSERPVDSQPVTPEKVQILAPAREVLLGSPKIMGSHANLYRAKSSCSSEELPARSQVGPQGLRVGGA